MTEDEMSDTKREDPGNRGRRDEEDGQSPPDRDGPIPFLEELFRGDTDAPEAVRQG